ncbi:MAG: transcriptional regulator [Chloroflexi bacterium]|nr:transcriptional regulator [Chloroflexota bacterium]
MAGEGILYTKLNPPRPQRYTWARPRVAALLGEARDHRVTIVQASTGYGKSTALAQLAQTGAPLFWYSASEGDTDAYQFLLNVIAAFRLRLPTMPDTPLAYLQENNARAAMDALINALTDHCSPDALFVIDDYYLAGSHEVNALLDHFLAFLPPQLHVILSTRYAPPLQNLIAWRATGQVLEIKRDALAFTRDEVATLFRDTYALALSPREVDLLAERTEGWPIALQLVWHEMRAKPGLRLDALLARGSGSLDTLFAYLAHAVLAQQTPIVQEFLLQTSTLREFDAAVCDAIRERTDSHALLADLRDRDLFLIALGGEHYRYHHLFHDFLREQAARQDADAVCERHRRAAEFYRATKNFDEAIHHFLLAHTFDQAAAQIEEIGENLLRTGRLETLAAWIDALPPKTIEAHPLIMFYLGDLARLQSRFDDALGWFAQVERVWRDANDIRGITRALRGQALVYLDTLRPMQAEALLQEALRLNDRLDDRAARARLMELLAENKLNIGKAGEAEQLRAQARELKEEGPSEDVLSVRVKLRTGQLDEARRALENLARAEKGQLHPPRGHRETLLILALIDAFQGQADAAMEHAQEGIALGARLDSPFITAVGKMRLGHALQLRGELRDALRCYEEAMALGDQLAVLRTRAEARWGMTRAHGLAGDLESARRDAEEGIRIARDTGDTWLTALAQLTLGASLALARRDREASALLDDALAGFRSCGDPFGRAATRLWLALASWRLNQRERALTHLDDALAITQAQHYDYLLTTRTLLGFQDARMIVPVMLELRRRGRNIAYIAHLLAAMDLGQVVVHPGYQLRVQTLGAFAVWRGESNVQDHEWQRRKARQLFQLFITQRGKMLQREEIFEQLWRTETPDAAARDFRVTLNALNRALEPERSSDDAPSFVVRDGNACGLRAGADLWIDADEFARLIACADKCTGDDALALYRRALALYHGDYLPDARYDDWASAERERLLALYLRAADRLAQESLDRGNAAECLEWCERILARDPCWEHASRMVMRVYAQRGDRVQMRRAFERCAGALKEEADLQPSPATVELYHQLLG